MKSNSQLTPGYAGDDDSVDAHATWAKADDRLRLAWTEGAVEAWEREAGNGLTVCFALGVDHAYAVQAAFGARGIAAEVITGDTGERERAGILGRFRSGETRVLINVNVLREGFDVPAAEVLLCLRPTGSLTLWLQMLGRVTRPKAGGAPALVLDLTDNGVWFRGQRLPYNPETAYKWSLVERSVAPPGESPEKECEGCGALVATATRVCGAYVEDVDVAGGFRECGYEFGEDCAGCREWRPWDSYSYSLGQLESYKDRWALPGWALAILAAGESRCWLCIEPALVAADALVEQAREEEEEERAFRAAVLEERRAALRRGYPKPAALQPASTGNGVNVRGYAAGGIWIGHRRGGGRVANPFGLGYQKHALKWAGAADQLGEMLTQRLRAWGGGAAGVPAALEDAWERGGAGRATRRLCGYGRKWRGCCANAAGRRGGGRSISCVRTAGGGATGRVNAGWARRSGRRAADPRRRDTREQRESPAG